MSEEPATPEKDAYGSIPIQEALQAADRIIERGGIVYFKFTCGCCGARQTFDKPNTLYQKGTCEECGKTTVITRAGFTVIGLI